jgi:hypothetical protein
MSAARPTSTSCECEAGKMKIGDSGEAKRRRANRATYEDPKDSRLGSQPDITRAGDIHSYHPPPTTTRPHICPNPYPIINIDVDVGVAHSTTVQLSEIAGGKRSKKKEDEPSPRHNPLIAAITGL